MNAMFDSLFAWLLDFSCLATVLLAAAIGLRWLLRQPASRVMLAWGTWLAILAGGVVLAVPDWPRIDLSAWLAAPVQEGPVVFVREISPQLVTRSSQSLDSIAVPHPLTMPSAAAPRLSPADIGARAWLAAALLACGWLLIGMVRAWRLIARSQMAPEWTRAELLQIVGRRRRMPGVLTNKQVPSALALGTLRPRIILPLASAAQSNASAVRAALAHEWAHIAAGDLWLLALERSLLPLLALHPLFWRLRRLTRLDQELAADAAAAGDQPAEYAEALLVWAKVQAPRHSGVAALAMWERPSNLSRRIHMILDPKRQSTAARRSKSAYVALALLLALGLGLSLVSWRPMSAQDQPQPQPAILLPATITEKTLPAPAAQPPTIMLELKLLTLDLRAIADAKVDFPITPDRPADVSKGGLITVQLGEKEASRLVDVILGIKGAEMLSEPQIVTLDGQEASLQVGGELPIVEVEESVGSERRERRVESKAFGTKLRVLPRIVPDDRRSVLVEIAGEKTSVNPAWKLGDNAKVGPLLSTHKIELAATVELGKTLVLLSPAKVDITAEPAAKNPPESLLILLRPSLVEHKYVEVHPDPAAGARSAAAIGRYTRTRLAQAETTDEAKLAEQLRSIRQAVEDLAREREASRAENAALRAELERLKAQLPAGIEFRGDAQYFRTAPLTRTASGATAARVSQVYQFPTAGEAADAGKELSADGKLEKHGAAIMVANQNVTLTGTAAAVKELSPILAVKGKLLTETEHGSRNAAWAWLQATTAQSSDAAVTAHPAGRVTRVYVFPGNKEAADAVRSLAAGWKAEGEEITVDLNGNSLIVSGTEASLAKAEPALTAVGAGNLAMQPRAGATEAVLAADPQVPQATIQKAFEWLIARQPEGQWQLAGGANLPSERGRLTQRKLLELDLQAAELELQAAQEDFEAAERLSKQNAISAEELRNKRRLVDRTRIQLAKLKVMLEAEQVPAAPAGTLQTK